MERSPSSQFNSPLSSSSEEQRNGSIFKRMYNSLHRPKKGSDPMVDIAERFEQERIRDQRKKDVPQQRPEKQKQHHTVTGAEVAATTTTTSKEVEDASPRYQSWRGDTTSSFGWDPKTKADTSKATIPTLTSPRQLQTSASLSYVSTSSMYKPASQPAAPIPVLASKPTTRGHSLTASSVPSPSSSPSSPSSSSSSNPPQASIVKRRFSLRTESPSSSTSPSRPPAPTTPQPDNQSSKARPDKSRPTPSKPVIPTFKEFRPEKKERVDFDELRMSYEPKSPPSEPVPDKDKPRNGHSRNPSRDNAAPDKPMNGVVITIISSRLPSTMLPGLQLLSTDEVRKAPPNRPRHPYIPKRQESSGSLFSGALRSSSAGKHSPRKPSPAAPDPNTRGKSPAKSIRKKKDNPLAESDSVVEPTVTSTDTSPTSYHLPRSHTEILNGVYTTSTLRRQRSHHVSNSSQESSPTSPIRDRPSSPATSPIRDRPSSPSSLTQSTELTEGFASIRRKTKTRNIKDTLTPSSRSLLKSKAAEVKKMQQQVVTAKDLAAFSMQNEGKLKLEMMFERTENNTDPSQHPSSTSSAAINNPPTTPQRSLSSTSSPAHIPRPPPDVSNAPVTRLKGSTLYTKSPSSQISATTGSPTSSPSPTPPNDPSSPLNSDNPPYTTRTSSPNIPISTPSSAPYPKPPYMLSKPATLPLQYSKDSGLSLPSPSPILDSENDSPAARPRSLSSTATIKNIALQDPASETGLSKTSNPQVISQKGQSSSTDFPRQTSTVITPV